MNHDDERDFEEERANAAFIEAEQAAELRAEKDRQDFVASLADAERYANYSLAVADLDIDDGCEEEQPGDIGRYLLDEKSTYDGSHWLSTWDQLEELFRYHDGQEYPLDWDIDRVVDLDTGVEIPVEQRTVTIGAEEYVEAENEVLDVLADDIAVTLDILRSINFVGTAEVQQSIDRLAEIVDARLDRESSASRQHWIDTGRYLRHEEVV